MPDKMCEPAWTRAMNGQVQKACAQFPMIAADICKELDVDYDYFNELSERMRKDPILRFRIRRVLSKYTKVADGIDADATA